MTSQQARHHHIGVNDREVRSLGVALGSHHRLRQFKGLWFAKCAVRPGPAHQVKRLLARLDAVEIKALVEPIAQ